MPKNILVIDDEGLITKTLKKLLQTKGYDVTIAEDGPTALEKVKEADFNLIISDMKMPQMDGVETIKNIRQSLQEQDKEPVPEIIITGYADEDRYNNAIDLKVADYLHKPFDNDVFLQVVQDNIK